MTNVIIVHGTKGSPEGNWFPWLKSELEKLGCNVFVPKFPTPENQSLDSWLEVFKDYEKYLDRNSIVVGHSLSPAFLMHVLEKRKTPIKSAFFVAPFTSKIGNEEYDNLNKTFYKEFEWERIKQNCRHIHLISGDNDPYVPLKRVEYISERLGVPLTIINGGGHLNAEFGYTKFPLLLEKIKEEL